MQERKGWQHLLALNKVLNCGDSGKFASQKTCRNTFQMCILCLIRKRYSLKMFYPLKSKSNVFWQADTVEYTKNDRDTSYLMNFESFYKSKMKPVAICDAYYIEPEYAILRSCK